MIDRRSMPMRFSLGSLILLCGAGNFAAEETQALVPELDVWGYSVEMRGGAGYRDNLLLEESNRESSYFLTAGSDLTVWRLPVDRHQFFFLISGDYFAYPDGQELRQEATTVSVAEYKNALSPTVEFGALLQYSYIDQVLGVLTETNFNPIPVTAHVMGWRPSARVYVSGPWWVEGEGYGSRHFFASPLDDLWEVGGRLHVGRDYGHRSSWQGSYQYAKRFYDHQPGLDEDGVATDQVLRTDQHEVEFLWHHDWDAARSWRSTTELGWQFLRDNNSGFFDFNRPYFAERIRYRTELWEIEGRVRYSYYGFRVQHTDPESGDKTQKNLISVQLRVSRRIVQDLHAFCQFEREQALSNRAGDDYTSNKIWAGVDWEF